MKIVRQPNLLSITYFETTVRYAFMFATFFTLLGSYIALGALNSPRGGVGPFVLILSITLCILAGCAVLIAKGKRRVVRLQPQGQCTIERTRIFGGQSVEQISFMAEEVAMVIRNKYATVNPDLNNYHTNPAEIVNIRLVNGQIYEVAPDIVNRLLMVLKIVNYKKLANEIGVFLSVPVSSSDVISV
ncbi:MAG: hypothetical protein ACSLEY_01415 [Candidatus Saccharimonadales bacterium]